MLYSTDARKPTEGVSPRHPKRISETSKALLNWWFNNLGRSGFPAANTPHLLEGADGTMSEFQYYFAHYFAREALETIIYLYEVVRVKDKFDLMRYDSSGDVSAGLFDESWRRFVVKLATGTGKTKVMIG